MELRRTSPDADGSARRWIVTGWSACLAWWVAAYVLTLDLQGWVFTELATLKAGRLGFAAMLADRATFGHCPLYFTLSWVVQRLFGESTVALRLPSAVLGLLAALLAYRIVRRWASESAALVTCLMVLLNHLLLEISQQARPYALTLVIALAATAILLDPRAMPDRRRAVAFGLASLAGLLTSHAYWFVLGAHAAVLVAGGRRHRPTLAAAAGAVAGAMPWTIYAKFFASSGGESERFLTWMDPVNAAVSLALPGRLVTRLPFEQGSDMTWLIVASLVAVGLAAFGLAYLPRTPLTSGSTPVRPTLAALWVGPPLAALAAGLAGWGNLLLVPRYYAPTAVVQLILICWAAWTVRPRLRVPLVALLAGILVASSVSLIRDGARDQVRRSAQVVAAGRQSNEAVVMIAPWSELRLLKHYLDAPVVAGVVEASTEADKPVSDRNFPQYRGRRRGVWLVLAEDSESGIASSRTGPFDVGAYLENLERRYHHRQVQMIGGWQLRHFWDPVRFGGGRSRPMSEPPTGGGDGKR